ncbi:MAG: prepilin-type N-terminal cleavage/methylation domain-containing protein [Planctomycetes bacterium]|nr:prepilin-type N-terminal cleavage/methylation domain-containing protein [Planctomycetota bacterium]
MRKEGFTLIELLVVIAIIAILMSVPMPALRSARDHAKGMHRLSKVRTLGYLIYIGFQRILPTYLGSDS